jgi:hypothetical protein
MKNNTCISALILCHGVTCYPGTSLGLLIDAVRQSGLKRLSFQDIQIKSSWALDADRLGVEQLEFYSCKIYGMKLESLLGKNKDLKTLLVQNTEFFSNALTWPNIGEALLNNPLSQISAIEWSPRLEHKTLPQGFWQYFCQAVSNPNSKLCTFKIPSLAQSDLLAQTNTLEREMLEPLIVPLTKSFS